jgi:hypothetical protein
MTLNTSGVSPVTQSMPSQLATGTYTGDGSGTVQANIGFTPVKVTLYNITDTKKWEWVQGMAATDSFYEVASADPTIDTGSAIVSNGALNTQASAGEYGPPGSSEAGDGTLQNTGNISVYAPNKTLPQLVFTPNVSGKAYVWVAEG